MRIEEVLAENMPVYLELVCPGVDAGQDVLLPQPGHQGLQLLPVGRVVQGLEKGEGGSRYFSRYPTLM